MDDHLYDFILHYAKSDLIPTFQKEYKEKGVMKECPSYKEVQDLCRCLNIVNKYVAYGKVMPSDFINNTLWS